MTWSDSDAMQLLDRLLDGSACKWDDVVEEFEQAGIYGPRDYIREYGAHITKNEILGDIWVYKNNAQKERLIENNNAVKLVTGFTSQFPNAPVPPNSSFFRIIKDSGIKTRGSVDRVCREMGYYIVGGVWVGNKRYLGEGTLEYCGKELMDDDRTWMLKEMKWMYQEMGMTVGEIDPGILWENYHHILKMRVEKFEFDRWVEIVNLWKSINRFLRVDSDYGY